jgi:hypothetical protein
LTSNPEDEPYYDGQFDKFKILIVCLYMGAREKVNKITTDVFNQQCGSVLRRKGFSYTFCCSYGEGIAELTKDENGRCPYVQLWLFCSHGYGDLPNEARDKDTQKIVPFMRAVQNFWTHGGGLLLFCDNGPFTFETNYLLSHYLTFNHKSQSGRTKVRFGGQTVQASGFSYQGYKGNQQITVAASESPVRQSFSPKVDLPAPGQVKRRISLRPGLIKFYEGNTISYACNSSNEPLTQESDLWPFTPFAWTSEAVSPPRPFILFYDPQIQSENLDSPGPIVIHGGFTAAFHEFGLGMDDSTSGTGRLIISIACWLTRIEERLYIAKKTATPLVTTVPRLAGSYSVSDKFSEWTPR